MTLPAVLLLGLFAYVPILGNVVAFQDYSPFVGIPDSPWVGLGQLCRVLSDANFWVAVKNTLVITAFQLIFFFPIPIILAILLNSLVRPACGPRSGHCLPAALLQLGSGCACLPADSRRRRAVEPAAAANGWQGIGHHDQPGHLLVPDHLRRRIWKDAGWGMIVFLAALTAIDPSQYEAAAVDGAGRWRRMWHITLPGLRPVIMLAADPASGRLLLGRLRTVHPAARCCRAGASEVLDTFVYFTGVQNGDWSYAAAAGLLKGVVVTGPYPRGQQSCPPIRRSRGVLQIMTTIEKLPKKSGGLRWPGSEAPSRAAWEESPPPAMKAAKSATLIIVVLAVLLPLYTIVLTSISTQSTITNAGGLVLIPGEISWDAYRQIFTGGVVTRAIMVSVGITAVGTVLSLVVSVLCAYGLSAPEHWPTPRFCSSADHHVLRRRHDPVLLACLRIGHDRQLCSAYPAQLYLRFQHHHLARFLHGHRSGQS